MRRTVLPCSESATPRFRVVVVFATPPFWFAKAMTLAIVGPLPFSARVFGRGSRRASPMASSLLAKLAESFCDTRIVTSLSDGLVAGRLAVPVVERLDASDDADAAP